MRSFSLTILAVAGGLLLAVAAILLLADHRAAANARLAVAQARSQALASILAGEKPTDGPQLTKLAASHPGTELYLIDLQGRIRASSLPEDRIVRRMVDPGPIDRFLGFESPYPLLGDDPKSLHAQAIFSAARLGDDRLYVLLPVAPTAGFPPMPGGRTLATLALLAGAAGLVAWMGLDARRRLRHLAETLESLSPRQEDLAALHDGQIARIEAAGAALSAHIRDQAEQVRQAEAMRRDLVASMAHDLRTPLASLRGYIETLLLRNDRLEEDERLAFLQIALRQSEHLQALITELFDLVKLEGGETQLNPEPFQVAELIQDVVQKLGPSARRSGVLLSGDLTERIPFVYGDVGLLERVFENVLDNAIRYTPSGGRVSLSVSAASDAVAVEISDTGRGIPSGDIPHIFERFYRVDKSRNQASGGVGLGLTIAKQIVDMHSGRIAVSSDLGSGTSFTITLPLAPAGPRGASA